MISGAPVVPDVIDAKGPKWAAFAGAETKMIVPMMAAADVRIRFN